MVAPHYGVFRTLVNTPLADPFVDEEVAGRAVAFLNVDSLKHRKLELRDENQKATIFSFLDLLWAFQNGLAHVRSYSQSLP